MSVDVRRLAVELAKNGCFLVGDFKLSSGITSPYYIDLRAVPSFPGMFELVINAYIEGVSKLGLSFDRIAGIATAGIPIATTVAYRLKKPFLYVRKEERTHGTKRLIEGVVKPGDTVLLVDDVATSGGNLLKAIDVLRNDGAKVEKAIVLVDREHDAKKNLAKLQVDLFSLTTSSELITQLYLEKMVTEKDYKKVLDYIKGGKRV